MDRISFLVFLLGAALSVSGCTECRIAENEARALVLRELAVQGLDQRLLSAPVATPQKCSIAFEYVAPDKRISYVVIDDAIHGHELHKWAHAGD